MARPTAFIRIGSDKAGTVTIANFVDRHRDALMRSDVVAPTRNCIGILDELVKRNQLATIDVFDSARFFEGHPGDRERVRAFLDNYESYDGKDIFLTTETLWGRLSRRNLSSSRQKDEIEALCVAIAQLLKRHHVKLILHLRRADRYLDSLYNQHIKSGGTLSLPAFLARPHLQHLPEMSLLLLDQLETVFGRDSILVKPFERSQMVRGDVIADLLSVLGRPELAGTLDGSPSNESLHRALIEVLMGMNRQKGKILPNRSLHVISGFLRGELRWPDLKVFLDPHQRNNVLESFAPFYGVVSERYRAGGELFQEEVPQIDPAFVLPDADAAFVEQLIAASVGKDISIEDLRRLPRA